jgi:hypothetical protein
MHTASFKICIILCLNQFHACMAIPQHLVSAPVPGVGHLPRERLGVSREGNLIHAKNLAFSFNAVYIQVLNFHQITDICYVKYTTF